MPSNRAPDPVRRFARSWLIALVAFNVLSVIATWVETTRMWPKGLGFPLMLVGVGAQALVLVAALSVAALLVVLLFGVFSANTRRLAPSMLALSAALVGTTLPAQFASFLVWNRAFEDLAARTAPLVEAIRDWEAKHGAPPGSLEALGAPVPETPCGCSPYRYALKSHANPWTLSVVPPFRGVGFNRFVYWPRGNYPDHDENGRFQRVGNWAWCRE